MMSICGLITGCILSSSALDAWERTAEQDCTANEKSCRRNADIQCDQGSPEDCDEMKDACEKKRKECQARADKKDEESFQSELNPRTFSKYQGFSSEQKIKAMDYADKNRMSPNDAVDKVSP